MLKRLSNDWTDSYIINNIFQRPLSTHRVKTLVNEIVPPSTFITHHTQAPADLTVIITTPSTNIEATVPLEPAVGVDGGYPATGLPPIK